MKEDLVITHDNLPLAVSILLKEVFNLKQLAENNNHSEQEDDKWFNLKELCAYHPDKPSIQTVYGWSSAGKIPSHSKGKKIYFLKSEIDAWLKSGRRKTHAEFEAEASKHVASRTQKKR